MAANSETIYVKADRNIEVTDPRVLLGDVLQIECVNPVMLARVKAMHLLNFPKINKTDGRKESVKKKETRRAAVSMLKVIACIHKEYPNAQVENIGETDFIVTYEDQKTPGKFLHYLKAAAVSVISFAGAAFSTMAFNNDVNVNKMFSQIYFLLTGQQSDGFTILELTYCIGLIIGILVFFNHFGKKKFSVDPTPMEVEMRLYENDIQTTLIENYARKGSELDVGSADPSGAHRS
jgi:stage V sporulation protein AA